MNKRRMAARLGEMNYEKICATVQDKTLKGVIGEFVRGIILIDSIDEIVYTRIENGTGSVGAHFRHNLDFANSFLNGVAEKRIDYNLRERDARVESDRRYAQEKFVFTVRRFQNLTDDDLERFVIVRSELDADRWLASTLSRELEFLLSHTVHHHALIAEKLRCLGAKVPDEFGVAPSTLEYWKLRDLAA